MVKKSNRPFKRVMAATLSVAMIATMLAPFTALAADPPSYDYDKTQYPGGYIYTNVTVDNSSPKPGDTITATIDMYGDDSSAGVGFYGFDLRFYYDDDQIDPDNLTYDQGWLTNMSEGSSIPDDENGDDDTSTDTVLSLSFAKTRGAYDLPEDPGQTAISFSIPILDSADAGSLNTNFEFSKTYARTSEGTEVPVYNGFEENPDNGHYLYNTESGMYTSELEDAKIVIQPTSLTLDKNSSELATGASETLTATVKPDNVAEDVEWKSSNPAIASVDPIPGSPSRSATVTGGSTAGTATITATIGEGENQKTATCTVSVVVPLTGLKVTPTTASVRKNETVNLEAQYVPAEPTNKPNIIWTSSDDSIATVEGVGELGLGATVTGKKAGPVTITATAGDTGFSANAAITVTEEPITGLTLTPDKTTINKGNTETLNATIEPSTTTDDKTITWSSDNTKVADVDSNGVVTAKEVGTATITASVDSSNGTTYSKTCAVTVNNPLTNITLNKSEVTLTPDNKSDTLKVSFDPTDASGLTDVVWTVDDADVVSITPSGTNNSTATITAGTKYGTAVITATETTTDGVTKTATCTVRNTNPLKGISLDKTDIELTKTETAQLTVTYSPDDTTDDKTVTWSSSDPSVVEVANGLVAPVKGGRAVITAQVGNFTATCNVFVNVPAEGASFSDNTINTASSLPVGNSFQMEIVYKPYDASNIASIVWTTSNENVADVDGNGLVTAKSVGTATITAKIVTLDGEEFVIEQAVNVTEAQNGGDVVPSPDNNGGATVTPSASNEAASSSTNNVKTGDAFPLAGIAALAALSAAGAVLIKRRKK